MFNWLDKPITWRASFKAAGISMLLTGLFYGGMAFYTKKHYESTEEENEEE